MKRPQAKFASVYKLEIDNASYAYASMCSSFKDSDGAKPDLTDPRLYILVLLGINELTILLPLMVVAIHRHSLVVDSLLNPHPQLPS